MSRTTYEIVLPNRRVLEVKDVVLEWAKSHRIRVLEAGDEHIFGRLHFPIGASLNFLVRFPQHLRGVRVRIEGWILELGKFEKDLYATGPFRGGQRLGFNFLADLVDKLKAMK